MTNAPGTGGAVWLSRLLGWDPANGGIFLRIHPINSSDRAVFQRDSVDMNNDDVLEGLRRGILRSCAFVRRWPGGGPGSNRSTWNLQAREPRSMMNRLRRHPNDWCAERRHGPKDLTFQISSSERTPTPRPLIMEGSDAISADCIAIFCGRRSYRHIARCGFRINRSRQQCHRTAALKCTNWVETLCWPFPGIGLLHATEIWWCDAETRGHKSTLNNAGV